MTELFELKALRTAANAGDLIAIETLLLKLIEDKNPEAVQWAATAANRGSRVGQHAMADIYIFGELGISENAEVGLKWCCLAAEQGDLECLYALGNFHANGKYGVEQDERKAFEYYKRAADAGDTVSLYEIAVRFHAGKGVDQDRVEALKKFRNLAESGNADAIERVGRYYLNGWAGLEKNDAEAANWFRRAAEAGNGLGANLARMLSNGSGVAQDKTEALKWYRAAAENGRADAANEVGHHYWKGLCGVERNEAEAVNWFRRAAEAGNGLGATCLATMLSNGSGVAQDKTEAFKWYRAAAENGWADAANQVGGYFLNGLGGVEKNDAEAANWFRRAAEAGSGPGARNLAVMLSNGSGVPQDKTEAFKWYRAAAENGEADAANMVGRFYEEGWGGAEKNEAEAVNWFRRAAEAGSGAGAHNLAGRLSNGSGVAQDKTEALKWYRAAAENGFQSAITELGVLLAKGEQSLEQDNENAAYWLRRGHELGDAKATAWLAHLHDRGLPGVVASKTEAKRLFKIAADKGIAGALERFNALAKAQLPPEKPAPQIVAYDRRFEALDRMAGLKPVKERLRSFAQLMDNARRRQALGYKVQLPTAHMMFLGNPGTGKTTIARVVGQLLASIGVLSKGHVIEVDRAKLVQVYIGETEKKTLEYIDQAKGGVLFVDEAYSLVPPDNPRDSGPRAIDTIMTSMENRRNEFVVIFAGYERQMKQLFDYNPGIRSRVPNRIEFPDYTLDELQSIALGQIKFAHGFPQWENGVPNKLRRLIEERFVPPPPDFGNAREMRNLADEIVARHASRPGASASTIAIVDIPDSKPRAVKRDPLDELKGMIGLAAVKNVVERWSAQLKVAQMRRKHGAKAQPRPNHMIFTGSPGTGKTVVAGLVARILVENGMLSHNNVHSVKRADLVGQYQGQTAPKVAKAFEIAEGGVLFIDEAYSLTRDAKDSFGQEAIDTMVPLIEDMRDRVIVILAGYATDMEQFLDANSGLRSRFPIRVHFEDYSPGELLLIFEKFCFERDFHLTAEARRKAETMLARHAGERDFGNARGVRNLVDLTQQFMDLRLANIADPENLYRIEAADIPE